MPSISKEDKTITWVCEAADEASARVDLQEILDANPGYTPILIVEDASGEEKTYTSLSGRRTRRQSSATEEPAEEEETTTSE